MSPIGATSSIMNVPITATPAPAAPPKFAPDHDGDRQATEAKAAAAAEFPHALNIQA
jgi:hypothetical protein